MAQRADNETTSDRAHDMPWVIAAIALSVVCTLLAGVTIQDILSDSSPPQPNSVSDGAEPSASVGESSLVMEVDNYSFAIVGYVADEATRQALEEATALTYGNLGEFDVVVDPNQDGVTNLEGIGQLPQNLGRLIDGSFEIYDNSITIRGVSPDLTTEFNLIRLATSLGFTDVDDQLQVAELRSPTVDFQLTGEKITASGEIPDERVAAIIEQTLVEQFGAENVDVTQLLPSAEVFIQFEIITTAANLSIYAGFGDFQLTIQNNDTVGSWDQGIGFSSGDASLTAGQEKNLSGFPPLLKNRPDLQILITGHTDDEGSPEQNQILSQQRAQAIVDFFVANGVNASRVIGIGRGANEPIASNDTTEGRAQNRRVTFALR